MKNIAEKIVIVFLNLTMEFQRIERSVLIRLSFSLGKVLVVITSKGI